MFVMENISMKTLYDVQFFMNFYGRETKFYCAFEVKLRYNFLF